MQQSQKRNKEVEVLGKTAQWLQDVLLYYLVRQTHDSRYSLTHRKWVYCTSFFSLINIKHIDSMITSYICPNLKASDATLFEEKETLDILMMITKDTEASSQTVSKAPRGPSFPLLKVRIIDGVEKLSFDQPLHFTMVSKAGTALAQVQAFQPFSQSRSTCCGWVWGSVAECLPTNH